MLRPALLAVLAVLLVAPAAQADATRNKILRECQNGQLSGDYTAAEIRDARSNIPDDVDQYTDCRDVLTRALLARAGGSGGGGGAGTGGGAIGGAGGSGGGGTDASGAPLTPSTDADREAIEGATGQPLEVSGRRVTPGDAALRNDLPTTVLVLLALLAVAAVAAVAGGRGHIRRLGAIRRVLPGRAAG